MQPQGFGAVICGECEAWMTVIIGTVDGYIKNIQNLGISACPKNGKNFDLNFAATQFWDMPISTLTINHGFKMRDAYEKTGSCAIISQSSQIDGNDIFHEALTYRDWLNAWEKFPLYIVAATSSTVQPSKISTWITWNPEKWRFGKWFSLPERSVSDSIFKGQPRSTSNLAMWLLLVWIASGQEKLLLKFRIGFSNSVNWQFIAVFCSPNLHIVI